MQCLQAPCSSKLSTSGRQRDWQHEQQQPPQQLAHDFPNSISHDVGSFFPAPTPFHMPHDSSRGEASNHHGNIDGSIDTFSYGWPDADLASIQIQYPVLSAANVAREDPSINSRSDSTKKRKAYSSPKPKETSSASVIEDSNSKRMKGKTAAGGATSETKQPKNEKKAASGGTSKENSKPPGTDYIHVRARRGQATDSHSLAERMRRERISERMKYLQELVPGCNKIMGKASMLDEIINYVQSLQKQVEFLSMKLAAVNPRMHLSDDCDFFDRELNSTCNSSRIPVIGVPSDRFDLSCLQLDSLQPAHDCSGLNMFMNAPVTLSDTLASCFNAHGSSAWDTGLHSFYGVECHQGRESAFPSQSLPETAIDGEQ